MACLGAAPNAISTIYQHSPGDRADRLSPAKLQLVTGLSLVLARLLEASTPFAATCDLIKHERQLDFISGGH